MGEIRQRTSRRKAVLFLSFLGPWSLARPALALDCKKAASPVEKAICADAKLQAEDERLNAAFATLKAQKRGAEISLLIRDQKDWLAERDVECRGGDVAACLAGQMEQRRRFLSGEPETGPGVGAPLLPWFRAGGGQEAEIRHGFALTAPKTASEKALNAAITRVLAKHSESTKDIFSGRYAFGSPRLASLQFQGAWEGGAHPMPWRAGINFDMEGGKAFEFGDAFPLEAKEKLLSDCRKQLFEEMRSSDPAIDRERQETLRRIIGDLGRWSFTPKGASIDFDHGEVNDYVEGDLKCKISISRLNELARPSFPLPR